MITQALFHKVKESKSNVIFPIYAKADLCSCLKEQLGYDISSLVDRKLGAITKIATLGTFDFPYLIFLGLGEEDKLTTKGLREALGGVFKQLKEPAAFNCKKAATDKEGFSEQDIAYYAAESFVLSRYQFKKYGTEPSADSVELQLIAHQDVSAAIQKGIDYAIPVNHTRDLGNTPSNLMTPQHLAEYAQTLADEYHLDCTILGNAELAEIKAGALLGVNQGSALEAKLIVLRYNGDNDAPYTALVGKGLTYDSGGYNLKSTGGKGMKYDMCGGANVLGAMEIIARRKVKANVMAVVPATENMISGEAYKADDVLVSMSGKTIEITNTDAEGRLILCDAITYAIRQGASKVIDIATLTGACMTALGGVFTGLFSNQDAFYDAFMEAAAKQDEKCWRLPTDEAFVKLLKDSSVADLVNSVTGSAGASIGACFLEQFVEEGVAWIHLDIAGSANAASEQPRGPKGATGVMVRSLAQLFES